MSDNATQMRATLEAWRGQGADRMDPVRFHVIQALARRAAGHAGETRQLLERKLSALIEAYADDLERGASSAAAECMPARGALGELAAALCGHAAMRRGDPAVPDPYPELPALDDFRKTWSRVRSQSQLRQSLGPAPANAGPLNSGRLVHRALTLMREVSPGYLQQFLSYTDTLSWLERMKDDGVVPSEDAPRVEADRKRPRSKPRKRRQ